MKTLVSPLKINNQHKQDNPAYKSDSKANYTGFAISFLLHFAILATLYGFVQEMNLQQNGDGITTISLATFMNPSNEKDIENPKPIVHKHKHRHKEIIKEDGKLVKQEEVSPPPAKSSQAKPDENIEEGEIIQTLSFKNGYEDEIFSKIASAIERKNKYPPMARQRGLEDEVIVEFIIYKNGKVSNIRILKSCQYEPFNRAAINAIKKAQNDFPTLASTTKVEISIAYKLNKI